MRPLAVVTPVPLMLLGLMTAAPAPAAADAAAPAAPLYMMSRCIRVSNAGQYESYMMSTTAKTMQVRADEGDIAGWLFAKTVLPSGEDARGCDFLQTNFHRGFPPARSPIDPYLVKAGLKITRDDWYKSMGEVSKLTRVELWRGVTSLDGSMNLGSAEKGHFLRVDFIKVPPARGREWGKLQDELWKPVQDAGRRAGVISGWQADQIVLPSGSEWPYGARRLTAFADWAAIGKADDDHRLLTSVHKGRGPALLTRADRLEQVVRSELFQIIAVVRPKAAAARPPAGPQNN
jgi:hypothetical protein